jgi:hypothetical protein
MEHPANFRFLIFFSKNSWQSQKNKNKDKDMHANPNNDLLDPSVNFSSKNPYKNKVKKIIDSQNNNFLKTLALPKKKNLSHIRAL